MSDAHPLARRSGQRRTVILAALAAFALSACAPGSGLPTLADGMDALSYDTVETFAVPSAGREGVVLRRRADGSTALGFRGSQDRKAFPGLRDPRVVGMFHESGQTLVAVEGQRSCGVSYLIASYSQSGGSASPIGDCGTQLEFASDSPNSVAAVDHATGRAWVYRNRRVNGPVRMATGGAVGSARGQQRRQAPASAPQTQPAYVRQNPALPPVSGRASAGSVVRGPVSESGSAPRSATGRFLD